MGKRKLDSDSSSDDDDDDENEKSIILSNENHSDANKVTEGSSGSVTGGKHVCELQSSSEEEKEVFVPQISKPGAKDVPRGENYKVEPLICVGMVTQSTNTLCSDTALISVTEAVQAEKLELCGKFASENVELIRQPPSALSSGSAEGVEERSVESETSCSSDSKSANANEAKLERPLNFEDFNSAVDMEVLGMDRIKSELQAHGLKCGGTLQERAATLFLLKFTTVDKLPKKLLAKK